MSTRSLVGILREDEKVESIYIHNDGYISHVGALLYTFYRSKEKMNKLISLGDLSSLGFRLDPISNEHCFESPEFGTTVAYGRDRDEENTNALIQEKNEFLEKSGFVSYIYIYTDNDFLVYKSQDEYLGKLSDLIEDAIVDQVIAKKDLNRILISGEPGSGKDTVADILVEELGYHKFSLSDPIYEEAKKRGMTTKDRALLQKIGKEIRSEGDDKLTRLLIESISKSNKDKVVISDCRDKVEYFILTSLYGFIPVRVSAPIEDRVDRLSQRDGMNFKDQDMKLLKDPLEKNLLDEKFFEILNIFSKDDLVEDVLSIFNAPHDEEEH